MARFVRLTRLSAYPNSPAEYVYVNPEHVVEVEESIFGACVVCTDANIAYEVAESPTEVVRKLSES
jgi:hypothetical protein